MDTLIMLLSEAGGLPNAEAVWTEHVTPTHPEIELCNYFVEGNYTTLLLHVTDDGHGNDFDCEVFWEEVFHWETSFHISMTANDEDRETATLFFLLSVICLKQGLNHD